MIQLTKLLTQIIMAECISVLSDVDICESFSVLRCNSEYDCRIWLNSSWKDYYAPLFFERFLNIHNYDVKLEMLIR